jgi:HK97 family phage major capsid protein
MKKLKKELAKLRGEIKVLSDKESLTADETKQLNEFLEKAEALQARIKALETLEVSDEQEIAPASPDSIVAQVKAEFRAEQEAQERAAAEMKTTIDEAIEEAREEWEANRVKSWQGGFSVPTETKVGDHDDGGLASFDYYLRTGRGAAYGGVMKDAAAKSIKFWKDDLAIKAVLDGGKAALQGQTDAEGGYLVPDDFWNNIVAKRDDMSVIRRVGATIVPTSLDRVLVPNEGTSMTAHAITAEEAAVDEEEPTFGQVIVTVHKATKLVKVSEELVADEAAGLQPFLSGAFARAEASWENTYFISTGTGTGQPKAALVSSSAANTAAGTNTVTAAEVRTLMFGLDAPYAESPSAALVARRATVGVIAGLTGNPFSFSMMPAGDISAARGQFGNVIDGIPIFSEATMPALATGAKVILFGDFQYYHVAERMGSVVVRLNELYAGNGQVGFLHKFRRGGSATQDEAFKHTITT